MITGAKQQSLKGSARAHKVAVDVKNHIEMKLCCALDNT
jgi:hypothetical protein